MNNDGMSLGARDEFLRLCGFASYENYLVSDLWNDIRNRLNAMRFAEQCSVCRSKTGLQWHHRWYSAEVLVGNFTCSDRSSALCGRPIVRLCSECHHAIHHEDDRFIPSMLDVDHRLRSLSHKLSTGAWPESVNMREFEKMPE